MSLAGDLLRERLERRARALAADLRTALLRSYDLLRKRLTDQELERLASGEDLAQVVTDPDARRALDLVQRELRAGVEASGRAWAQDVPGVGRGIAFNVLNPDVVTAIQGLNTRVMQTFTDTVREAIRTQTEIGIRAGVNPRTTARHLREAVGLAPNQVRAIDNFRRMLEEGDREALTRALRDRRFDGTLARAFDGDGLTEAQIDRMTEAYRRRMQAFHAETIARTAALDAQRLGQHLTWQGAVERGDVDGDQLTKRWSGTLDDRERATHLAMEGETVAWDALYSNGQMQPGDSEYNCRCVSIYSTRSRPKAGAGAYGIAGEQLVRGAAR